MPRSIDAQALDSFPSLPFPSSMSISLFFLQIHPIPFMQSPTSHMTTLALLKLTPQPLEHTILPSGLNLMVLGMSYKKNYPEFVLL